MLTVSMQGIYLAICGIQSDKLVLKNFGGDDKQKKYMLERYDNLDEIEVFPRDMRTYN